MSCAEAEESKAAPVSQGSARLSIVRCSRDHCKTADDHLEENVQVEKLDALRLKNSTRLFDLDYVLRTVPDHRVKFFGWTAPRTGHHCAGQHDGNQRWGNTRSCDNGSAREGGLNDARTER